MLNGMVELYKICEL